MRPVHDDPLNGALAQAGFAVVSVDYRYAPENPFQAVIDDCETALAWALQEGERTFGVPEVLLHGDSGGAHLSLTAELRCRGSTPELDRLKGMVLFFGCYDLSATPSVRAAPDRINAYAREWMTARLRRGDVGRPTPCAAALP